MVNTVEDWGLSRCGKRAAHYAADQPHEQGDHPAYERKWNQNHRNNPGTAEIGDIPANRCRWIAANPATKDGHISVDLRGLAEADAGTEGRRVAIDLSLTLDHNTAADSGHVPRNMSANVHTAADAGRFADFFSRSDTDIVSNLSAVTTIAGNRGRRSGGAEQHADQGEPTTPHSVHHRLLLSRLVNYGPRQMIQNR